MRMIIGVITLGILFTFNGLTRGFILYALAFLLAFIMTDLFWVMILLGTK